MKQICYRSLVVFLSRFLFIYWLSLVAFDELIFQKHSTKKPFRWEFCIVQQGENFSHQGNEQVFFYKNGVFISLVEPSETGKPQPSYKWFQIGTLQVWFDKVYFFNQHSPPAYDVMQKEIENLELVRDVNFEIINSLKNNDTK